MRTLRTIAAVALSLAMLHGVAVAKGGGGFGGGGGGSFGGGSRGFSAPSTSTFSAPSSKGFSAPSISVAPRVTAPPPAPSITTSKPVQFDSGATRARATEESRANFRANSPEAPKPAPTATSTDTSWRDRPIFAPRPTETRSPPPTSTAWVPTRTVVVREQVNVGGGTDAYFWLWLMEHNQNQRQRDDWIYHNRDRVSQEQMDELRRRDSGIDERLRKLEAEGVQRDPNFRIPDSDYKDKTVTAPAEKSATSTSHKGFWLTIGLMLLLGAFVYLVFFKRFPSRRYA